MTASPDDEPRTGGRPNELRELALVLCAFTGLTALLTAPLAFRLGRVAYNIGNGDGQFSIWNTAWVARALWLDPWHVFDANIFYPYTGTLAYSEANLGSGALALPVYWATGNAYTAHGFVVLLSFVLSAAGAYYLVRYLTADRLAAWCGGVIFAFCPHVFAHLLHVQLLWIAGLPWSLLAFHRLIDRQTIGRAVTLGLAMTAQLYLCAYYAVFLVLVVAGFSVAMATVRRRWTAPRYWGHVTLAAAVSFVTALPLLVPYVRFQRATGFVRPLSASDGFSADWRAYVASSAYAHAWWLPWLGHWNEVLFPGFVAVAFAAVGLVAGWTARGRRRETTMLYGTAGLLALWASFGPAAGFYRLLYASVPALTLMRAPSRFGVVVLLAITVLAGLGIAGARGIELDRAPALEPEPVSTERPPHAACTARSPIGGALRSPITAGLLILFVIAEHVVPLDFQSVPPPDPAYVHLATLPRGALLELPVYSERFQFVRTKYMLASTVHWMPLVNAYSDYIPADFEARMEILGEFPTHESFRLLGADKVRYAMFHLDDYGPRRAELEQRLAAHASFLSLKYEDASTRLYELTGIPD